jgi:hypothetical protein
MSRQDNQRRHWRVKGNNLEHFSRDPKTKKDSIVETMSLVPLKNKETHKCGGTVMKVAGMPRLFGDWKVCTKCSAEIKNEKRQEEHYQRRR